MENRIIPTSEKSPNISFFTRACVLIVATVMGAAIAFGISKTAPDQWAARLVLQPGQITEVVGSEVRVRPLEASPVILTRYNLPAFKADVLKAAGLPPVDSGNRESKLVFETLQASPARSGDTLVSTQVSAFSAATAENVLNVAFGMIKAEHEREVQSVLAQMKAQFDRATVAARGAEREYERALAQLKELKGKGDEASATLLSMVISTTGQTAIEQSKRAALYEDAMNPARVYETRPLASVHIIPPGPLMPQSLAYMLAGGAIGLMLGILFLLYIASRRR